MAIGHPGTLIFGVKREHRGPKATIDSRRSSFFEDLALNWRGWDGGKTFDSLEGDFQLSAKHDRHIRISFELAQFEKPTTWATTGELTLRSR